MRPGIVRWLAEKSNRHLYTWGWRPGDTRVIRCVMQHFYRRANG